MAHFSASEHYKDRQCVDIHLPGYSEGLALHMLLLTANLTLDESDDQEWIDNNIHHHFTITVDGRSIDFIFGAPQYEALLAFIDHLAAENMHYVDPDYKYVEGVL